MSTMMYEVSRTEDGKMWYAHMRGSSHIPVFGSFSRTRRGAEKFAARCDMVSFKEWKSRR